MVEPRTPPGPALAAEGAPTAVPSVAARVVAFVAILAAGAAGAFIGWAFVDLQTDGDAALASAVGALVGAVIAASGVGVVTVLALRAMDEWRALQARGGPAPDPARRHRDPRTAGPPPRVR